MLGCGMRSGAPPAPTPTAGSGDERLVSAADRARLAALMTARHDTSADVGYRIGADDLLDVRIPDLLPPASSTGGMRAGAVVAETPIFQQGLRVNAQGDVAIPLLGVLPAGGKTPTELESDIAAALKARGLLRNPQVTVAVVEYRSAVVAVVGSVEKPGLYPLTRPNATLADMLWAAGGPAKDAGRVVEFMPEAAGNTTDREPIRLDVDVLQHDLAAGPASVLNPPARPGDVLRVAAAGSVQVEGWVDKPGSYPITRGMTVRGAIAAAGGKLYPADLEQVHVQRTTSPGQQQVFTVDLANIGEARWPTSRSSTATSCGFPPPTRASFPTASGS
jgi:polysaccharide export outer membrane protein